MREVKRYDPINNDGTCGMCVEDADYGAYVEYADYAALEAECERLRVKLMVIASAEPARHGIEWAKAIAAEGNGEPYAKWREAIEGRDALAAENARLRGEISDLHTTMMAAAVEIQEHWAAHCDEDGYGPINLMRRLENGIAAQYGYTAQALVQLKAERDTLRQQLADVFEGNTKLHVLWTEAVRQRDKLAQVLENVEREHDLIRQMKNCEIQRGRGSFGIAVMSDQSALEWQALDKELQQLIDARRAALSELTQCPS